METTPDQGRLDLSPASEPLVVGEQTEADLTPPVEGTAETFPRDSVEQSAAALADLGRRHDGMPAQGQA